MGGTLDNAVRIGDRWVGPGRPAFIVAELSANHGGSIDEARRLIDLAVECGADAVKLQTYTADTLTLNSDRPEFRVGGGTVWDGRTLHQLYAEASMPWAWQPILKRHADTAGIPLFSTPFDRSAVDFLVQLLDVPALKIASFELVDLPLIDQCARTGRPLILSTGMGSRSEIDSAVRTARAVGCRELILLKCTSAYPAGPQDMHLRTIADMASTWQCPIGLSDHSLDPVTAVTAVAMGACLIEKHFIRSRSLGGPDAAFSVEPEEFRSLVRMIRTAESAIGAVHYGGNDAGTVSNEQAMRHFRRSLYVVADIRGGERFTERHIRSIRPALGLPPGRLSDVLGKICRCDVSAGTPLTEEMIGDS